VHTGFRWGNLRDRDLLEYPGINGRIILRCIFRKWGVGYGMCRKCDFVLQVPKVYWNLSTIRVLTMEYVEGGQVNDLAYIRSNDIDRYEVADKLSQLYSQMVFYSWFCTQ